MATIPQHDMARASVTSGAVLPYPGVDATEEDKARWTANRWSKQDTLYEPFYRTWQECIAFIRSRHYDEWSPTARATLPPRKDPPWRKRLVSNYIFALWKTFVAKLTKNRPTWDVRPASGDPQDVNAALLARSILEWMWTDELKLARKWRRLVSWVVSCGNCWVEVFWNTNTGKMVALTVPVTIPNPEQPGTFVEVEAAADPETGEPILDQLTGMPAAVEPQMVDMGQVDVAIHSPFAVRTNPEAFTDPDALTDVMVGVPVSRDWFERVYGPEMAGMVEWGEISPMQHAWQALETVATGGNMDAMYQTLTPSTLEARGDQTLLIRHYHIRDSQFPEGRFWVAASNGAVVEPEQPLPLGEWPLVHVPAYPSPALLLSMSPVEPVIPLNKRINELNNKIAEHEDLMVHGKWMVPKTANIRRTAITSEPGEVIEYTPPFEPRMADIKALPAAIYNERENAKAELQYVSGIHKISMGEPPPGVTAGRAFLVLQEADDTDLGIVLSNLSDALADIGFLVLLAVRKFYTEERVVSSVSSESGEWMYRDFVGNDLDPTGRGGLSLQVKVQEGSMFPWLKAASQEIAIQLMQTPIGQTLLVDPKTGGLNRQRLAALLQVGGLENLIDATDMDIAEGERIYDDLARYEMGDPLPAPIPEWQNLAVHVDRFETHLKSRAFKALPPVNQELVLRYYAQIKQMLMKSQAQAAASASQQIVEAKAAERYGEESGRLRAQGEFATAVAKAEGQHVMMQGGDMETMMEGQEATTQQGKSYE